MNTHELGFQVHSRRRDLGISQENLAKQVGISRNYISLIERGAASNVSVIIITNLAKALGTSTSELTGEIENSGIVISSSLRTFAREDNLGFGVVEKLLSIPRRGREPKTSDEWRQLYNKVKDYLDEDDEE
ncbi:helix-turn-helix domain-containing protein [Herpetosiphon giganteus]|uniref:helix-turn-helix domain-containing protein n=1 Tax=Herpetosiphon giganteus TaxID=2029754 RepID=UPI001956674C|nr:transcriptional regulator [Herpetosiphon giganteus]MBM7842172.1 transcriptional regulator with XRE-family HTH domain [Herpetosiphon giganteus]